MFTRRATVCENRLGVHPFGVLLRTSQKNQTSPKCHFEIEYQALCDTVIINNFSRMSNIHNIIFLLKNEGFENFKFWVWTPLHTSQF